jgi:hypothetical protein
MIHAGVPVGQRTGIDRTGKLTPGVHLLQWMSWWHGMWCPSSSSHGGGSGRSTAQQTSRNPAGRQSRVSSRQPGDTCLACVLGAEHVLYSSLLVATLHLDNSLICPCIAPAGVSPHGPLDEDDTCLDIVVKTGGGGGDYNTTSFIELTSKVVLACSSTLVHTDVCGHGLGTLPIRMPIQQVASRGQAVAPQQAGLQAQPAARAGLDLVSQLARAWLCTAVDRSGSQYVH